jgi:GNAT superfamily N-acetyltransferase
MTLDVFPATAPDNEEALALRDNLARWLFGRGIEQWRCGDLPRAVIEHDVGRGWVHVVRDATGLVASVTVLPSDLFVWGERAEPAGYVHRLMVDRRWAGQGAGAELLAWAEEKIRTSNASFARLDCVRSNERLRAYYQSRGYVLVGYKDFPGIAWANETASYQKELVRPSLQAHGSRTKGRKC